MSGLRRPWYRNRTSAGVCHELGAWLRFLDGFNGVFFWEDELCLYTDFQVHTDAAGTLGYGIYFRGH